MEAVNQFQGMLNSKDIEDDSHFPPDQFNCIPRPLNFSINENYTVTINLTEIDKIFPNSLKWIKIIEEKFYVQTTVNSHLIYEQDEITLKVNPGVKYWFHIYVPFESTGFRYVYRYYYECIMGKAKIKELYTKACELFAEIKNPDTPIESLYRCKPTSYFDKINKINDGVMYPYIKDNTGHPGNPITGKVRGLFFSGKLHNGTHFPKVSPYGDKRFIINAHYLLDPTIHNYYFSDMYCTKDENTHNLTIVVCKKNTPEDAFCKENLVFLPSKDNEFIYCIYEDYSYQYYWNWCIKNRNAMNFELFYCGPVDINKGIIENVIRTGRGTTTPGGIGHNRNCKLCNF